MRIVVSTCDKYDHLMPGFAHQFNKYWDSNQAVDVLGFRPPPRELPGNFVFHSMEPVETRSWTDNLRGWFAQQPDEYFVFLLDDYWLVKPVDMLLVDKMEREVKKGAVKGDLSRNTAHFAHVKRNGDLVEAASNALYRTSTQPCIWRRGFMLNLLRPRLSPWQFELQDNPAVKVGRIVGTDTQIYDYANIYYKGAVAPYMVDLIVESDQTALKELGYMDWVNLPTQEENK